MTSKGDYRKGQKQQKHYRNFFLPLIAVNHFNGELNELNELLFRCILSSIKVLKAIPYGQARRRSIAGELLELFIG